MQGLVPRIKSYGRLFRFRYHLNFISVIAGVLFASGSLSAALAGRVAMLYVSFNVLLYGGLYTLNEVTDLPSDRSHPTKSRRPVASGEITVGSALVFAAVSLASGLLTSRFFFGADVFRLFPAFILVNVLYSVAARKVPYLELAVNASTHPLRFALGASLVGGKVPALFLAAYFFCFLGFVCVRRVVEMDVEGWQSRQASRRYSRRGLLAVQAGAFAMLAGLAAIDRVTPGIWYAVTAGFYAGGVFGIYVFAPIRRLYRASFTR
jgi:4-hydroxybenzoate polyprenyltransferase